MNEKKYTKISKEILKKNLTNIQYEVTQNNATEQPYNNQYYEHFEEGIYVDITNNEPLFISSSKYQSGCGWPAFSEPINSEVIQTKVDYSHNMKRVEVRTKNSDIHLGHVFEDNPYTKDGLRYCINSAALKFIPKKEMAEKGYAKYLILFAQKK